MMSLFAPETNDFAALRWAGSLLIAMACLFLLFTVGVMLYQTFGNAGGMQLNALVSAFSLFYVLPLLIGGWLLRLLVASFRLQRENQRLLKKLLDSSD